MASNKVVLGGNFSQLRGAVRGLGGDFSRAGQEGKGAFRGIDSEAAKTTQTIMKGAQAVLAMGAAFGALAWNATDAFGKIDTLTRRAVSLTGNLTQAAVDAQHAIQTSLSIQYGVDSAEVSRGFYQAISAGARPGEEANALVETALQFRRASGVEVGVGAQYLQSIGNVFGIEARDVGDITRAVEEAAITTIPELVQAQGRFLPQAKELGLGLEEALSLYGGGTLGGLQPRFAASGLSAVLREMLDPNSKLAVAIGEQFGKNTKELVKDGKMVIEILNDLKERVGEEPFTGLLTSESQRLALPFTSEEGMAQFTRVYESTMASAGKLQEVEDFIAKSPERQLDMAKQAWANTWEEIGQSLAPVALELATTFREDVIPIVRDDVIPILENLAEKFGILFDVLKPGISVVEKAIEAGNTEPFGLGVSLNEMLTLYLGYRFTKGALNLTKGGISKLAGTAGGAVGTAGARGAGAAGGLFANAPSMAPQTLTKSLGRVLLPLFIADMASEMTTGRSVTGSLVEGISSFFDPNISLNTGGRKGSQSFSNYQGATMLIPADNEEMVAEASRWVQEGATEYFDKLGKLTIEGIKKFYDQSQWPQRVWDAIGVDPPSGNELVTPLKPPYTYDLTAGLNLAPEGQFNLEWWKQRDTQTLFDAFGGKSNAISQFQSAFGGDGIDSEESILLNRLVNAAEITADNTNPEVQIDRAGYFSPIDTGDFLKAGA